MLLRKIADAVKTAQNRSIPKCVGFLNPHERACVLQYLQANPAKHDFFGGYDGAQRVIFVALPDWADDAQTLCPIRTVQFIFKPEFSLSHRDFLGTFMSLGITREKVGDILVGTGQAIAFLHADIADYLVSQIEKIGGVGVQIDPDFKGEIDYQQQFEAVQATVASARLDCVVGALCRISREKASTVIAGGKVFLNQIECTNGAKKVRNGDVVTVRGTGQFLIDAVDTMTKKGRVRLLARKKS